MPKEYGLYWDSLEMGDFWKLPFTDFDLNFDGEKDNREKFLIYLDGVKETLKKELLKSSVKQVQRKQRRLML